MWSGGHGGEQRHCEARWRGDGEEHDQSGHPGARWDGSGCWTVNRLGWEEVGLASSREDRRDRLRASGHPSIFSAQPLRPGPWCSASAAVPSHATCGERDDYRPAVAARGWGGSRKPPPPMPCVCALRWRWARVQGFSVIPMLGSCAAYVRWLQRRRCVRLRSDCTACARALDTCRVPRRVRGPTVRRGQWNGLGGGTQGWHTGLCRWRRWVPIVPARVGGLRRSRVRWWFV
jgi:hypothetical protein